MKKYLLDTNVWLRFILNDDQEQFEWSNRLINLIEENKIYPYISPIVFMELNFILVKLYKFTKSEVENLIQDILMTRNLVIANKMDFLKSFEWHKKYRVKLADCLIVGSLPKNCQLVTWDNEFKKINDIKTVSPKEAVEEIERKL